MQSEIEVSPSIGVYLTPMLERLQKIIARAGIASRRRAEQLIVSGQVRVNGAVVTELGSKADPVSDRIEVAGRALRLQEEKVYLVLHKPGQVVSTMADPEGRTALHHFLSGVPGRVFPVGRLDYSASGLVLLTSDGELASEILKASPRLLQTYWIKVKGRLRDEELRRVEHEVSARMHALRSPRAAGGQAANAWYEVSLSGARRDRLRKTLVVMGHPVEKMKRMKLANLSVEDVPEGRYRRLEPEEIAKLKRILEQPSDGARTGRRSAKAGVVVQPGARHRGRGRKT